MNNKTFNLNTMFIALLSVLMIFTSAFGFQVNQVNAAPASDNAVTISATDLEGEEVLPLTVVDFQPGDNAYDVLKAATDKKEITLQTNEYPELGHFVEQIGDVAGDDAHYWSFNTQGVSSSVGPSGYEVNHGDNLKFTLIPFAGAPKMNVSVVAKDKDGNLVLEKRSVELVSGSTVYDALYQAAKAQGVNLDVSMHTEYFALVENIGDSTLGETDFWSLSVNNVGALKGASQYELADGDVAQFTLESWDDPSEGEEEGDENIDLENGAENEDNGVVEEDTEEDNDVDTEEQAPQDKEEQEADKAPNTEDDKKASFDHEMVKKNIQDLLKYAEKNTTLEYGSEWWIWSLAHTDYNIPTAYVDSINEAVKKANGEFRGLELQKIIISLSLLGEDVTDFAGENLIEILLANMPYAGINGDIYTLIALDSDAHEAPEGVRADLIQSILDQELENGGWSFFGETPTADITAMALMALAPYKTDENVAPIIEQAVATLSDLQEDNGGFYDTWNGGDVSESVSFVIAALSSLNIDPLSAEFVKKDGNLLSHLQQFKQADGGYGHVFGDTDSSAISSPQALMAYVAYDMYLTDAGLFYQKPVEKPDPGTGNGKGDTPKRGKPKDKVTPEIDEKEEDDQVIPVAESNDETKTDTKSGEELPATATPIFNYLAIGLVLLITGVAVFLFKRKETIKH